ncbi:hypothetical protein P154DRAFT_438786 [Amniculicola lignicola CBS 123094]|uniref:Uncharacterized protein n=1 Tax=Amniculicola lignicola CBS 123094 TaxID=1392246 RepID=A0A6A5WAF3_9PLEO|nr:hypothetical protein P154DRAFT_438786 [Amniculicola lignicola CBS 123094]
MVGVNVMARGKLKKHCLTFGDVIVASASDPELRVQGECMVNANDSYRRETIHTCHKHCKSGIASMTGDELGHCQKCTKQNKVNKLPQTPQPTIATKFKKSLISNMGNTALTQMLLLMFCSFVMLFASVFVGVFVGMSYNSETKYCHEYEDYYGDEDEACRMSDTSRFGLMSGGFGGFNHSLTAATLPPDQIKSEILSFCISNGAQFIYSLLYLMLIYNITLVSQEHSWGHLEHHRKKLRCTIVRGESFSEDYLLQLPKKILFPIMVYSVLTHWMLGEALQTQEAVWREDNPDRQIEHSKYIIVYAAYPLWGATFLILLMTSACWWAYTYKREGFIPQMFGSIRTLCAATSQLDDFPSSGVMWGDLGLGKQFRHAGLSAEDTVAIEPNELYAGVGEEGERIGGKERSNDCEVRMGTEEGRRRNVGDVKKWKDFDGENWRRGS